MNRPALYVSEDCRNVLFSFQNYTWDEHSDMEKAPKDKPRDVGKDHMDTLRYALVRDPHYVDWRDLTDWFKRQRAKRLFRGRG